VQTVYIETTIPSYLAAKPSSVPSIASDQRATHYWWENERPGYRVYTSRFTLDEAAGGDSAAAARRLDWIKNIPRLPIMPEAEQLASDIAKLLRLPPKAIMDASHVALSILHKMDYLLTWNCTHLANPVLQKELVEYCGYHELHVPIICTPSGLIVPPS
jgi:PIN domain